MVAAPTSPTVSLLLSARPNSNPRTFKLVESSSRKIAQKVIEEAGEVAIEAVRYHANGVVRESADLEVTKSLLVAGVALGQMFRFDLTRFTASDTR
jgi:phosphoribosyl-ATP pyrophosphohydrolase